MRWRRRSGCARAPAATTSLSSSSTRAGGSRPASGTTSSCSSGASPRATPSACSAASTASATGSSSRCARSRRSTDTDPADLAPAMRRDADELDGFLEFLAGELAHPGLKATVGRFVEDASFRKRLRRLPAAPGQHHDYAGGLLEHTVGVATLCREAAQLHPRLRTDLLARRRAPPRCGPHGRARPGAELRADRRGAPPRPRPSGPPPDRGALRRGSPTTCEQSCCTRLRATTTPAAARTAEAAVLYHANQLDAAAAIRPVQSA